MLNVKDEDMEEEGATAADFSRMKGVAFTAAVPKGKGKAGGAGRGGGSSRGGKAASAGRGAGKGRGGSAKSKK